jgi:hypothetical protein
LQTLFPYTTLFRSGGKFRKPEPKMAEINGRLVLPPEKPSHKTRHHQQQIMAASPGAGIEAMWSYCTKKEERVNGEVREVVRCLFCDDKLSNTATRIEEHLTGLRLRNGALESTKKPCTSTTPDLKEAMAARKKQL